MEKSMTSFRVNLVESRLPFLAPLCLTLASCATPAPMRTLECEAATLPTIKRLADGATATTTLSVLTYNMEGLAWPARHGRAAELREIGRQLNALRSRGSDPDIVLFQEMFRGVAKEAVAATGYPAIASGPGRTTRPSVKEVAPLPGRAKIQRGELGFHLTGSGLAIASRYPILETQTRAYGKKACAGFDCLANKGIMLARLRIPGVPGDIDIYNTHMNAARASKAPQSRNLAAHERQALQASEFIETTHDDATPVILGGDFNMRHSEERWENFSRYQSLKLVHQVCADPTSRCDVRMSWDGDAPWMDTQDLQFFWPGRAVSIRPVRVEALFDGTPGSPRLSDHDGFMVTYELSWLASASMPASCSAGPNRLGSGS
jgi:endonuclease/exonuclease/phosphatase family metal-dependent hydrolase